MTRVSNERAVIELTKALKQLDEACPDVGIGPSWNTVIDEAIKRLGLTIADVNPLHVLDAVSRRRR